MRPSLPRPTTEPLLSNDARYRLYERLAGRLDVRNIADKICKEVQAWSPPATRLQTQDENREAARHQQIEWERMMEIRGSIRP